MFQRYFKGVLRVLWCYRVLRVFQERSGGFGVFGACFIDFQRLSRVSKAFMKVSDALKEFQEDSGEDSLK